MAGGKLERWKSGKAGCWREKLKAEVGHKL